MSIFLIYKLPAKFQWVLLLIDSIVFYFLSAIPYSFVYIVITSLSVWFATLAFDKYKTILTRRIILLATLIVNILLLASLKYTNLVIEIFNLFNWNTQIKPVNFYAPVGISFYTLTMISYLLDNYWGITYTEKNPLKVILLTSYFPLMISGPICRHNDLGNQLFTEHKFKYTSVTSGLKRVTWGIAKKVIVANSLQPLSYLLFNKSDYYSGVFVIFAAVVFAFQLYFDFSGCMDIVCGISKALDVELEENFNAPFFSRSIQEIWQRWHITLGGFMRDYVMNPILKTEFFINMVDFLKIKFGKKTKKIPSYIAMLIVWVLIGLWHGPSVKYIIGEGLYFYVIILLSQIISPVIQKIYKRLNINDSSIFLIILRTIITIVLFSIGLIFFNAVDFSQAVQMIKNIRHSYTFNLITEFKYTIVPAVGGLKRLSIIVLLVLITLYNDFCIYYDLKPISLFNNKHTAVRWASYFILIFVIIIFGDFGKSSFIYFGF